MRKEIIFRLLVAVATASSLPASAVYNATVTGNVSWVQQDGPNLGYAAESIVFALDNQPATSCGYFQMFSISPNYIADAQTRKNMLAMLMTAKATGSPVTVAYDSAGGYCDQGMPAVYYIVVR
jgi:hypothetical protein